MSSIMLCILLMCAKLAINQPTTELTTSAAETTSVYTTTTDAYTSVTGNDNRDDDCPPDKSWNSAEDIVALIEYVYNNQSLDTIIKTNYTAEAQKIAEKYLRNITLFEEWIDDRPQHLLHILKVLATQRKKYFEPLVDIISTELNENPQLEAEFQTRVNAMQQYVDEYEKYEVICKYNCMATPETDVQVRSKRSIEEGYYCSSLEDLYNEVVSKLLISVNEIKTQAQLLINQKNKYNAKKIAEIRKKLQETALASFGGIMYELLDLQDEYYHFNEDNLKINISADLFSIKDLGFKIDDKLLIVGRLVKEYGEKCINCGSMETMVNSNGIYPRRLQDNNQNANTPTIVDALIKVESVEIWESVQKDIDTIFDPLREKLAMMENIDDVIQRIQHIKEEAERGINEERAVLDKLEDSVPQESVNKIIHLLDQSQFFLKQIEEMEQTLNSDINNMMLL